MANLRDQLMSALGDLSTDDFKEFKFYLDDKTLKPRIPWSKLEHADRSDTLRLLMGLNPQVAVDKTMEILGKINRNDLVQVLEDVQVQVEGDMR